MDICSSNDSQSRCLLKCLIHFAPNSFKWSEHPVKDL